MSIIDKKRFSKDFTLQEPINEKGIEKALAILKSGKIHRYNVEPGEKGEAALLEEEFAAYMGKKYCLSCASCGSAMYLALKSAGVKPGDKVLCNAYTLAPNGLCCRTCGDTSPTWIESWRSAQLIIWF